MLRPPPPESADWELLSKTSHLRHDRLWLVMAFMPGGLLAYRSICKSLGRASNGAPHCSAYRGLEAARLMTISGRTEMVLFQSNALG